MDFVEGLHIIFLETNLWQNNMKRRLLPALFYERGIIQAVPTGTSIKKKFRRKAAFVNSPLQ